MIKVFNKAYPSISVTAVNVGAGNVEFTKLLTSLTAGSGAPDVSQMQWPTLPQFVATHKILNIAKYVDQYKSYYPSFAWDTNVFGNAVYGVPEDWGTRGLAYRPAIFKKYHLVVPRSYTQFASDALKLHRQNPSLYMTEFPFSAPFLLDLFWQAGINVFKNLGNNKWKVAIATPATQRILGYWGRLVREHAVLAVANYTPADNKRIADGVYASYFLPAWGPAYQLETIKPGTQHFSLTRLPSWNPAHPTTSSDVSSLNLVTDQTKHPRAAALFAAYINLAKPELQVAELPSTSGGRGLFPSANARATVPAFNEKLPIFGTTPVNQKFSKYTNEIPISFQWSPWQSYIDSQVSTLLSSAASGHIAYSAVLPALQHSVVQFARSEGYNIVNS